MTITGLNGTIEHTRIGPEWSGADTSCFIQADDYNRAVAKEYKRISENTLPISAGAFRLFGWVLAGSDGLLLSPSTGICLVGEAVGWGIDFTRWYTEQYYNAQWSDDGTEFSINDIHGDLAQADDLGVFISSPGQNIYGHWILDYIPRLYSLKSHHLGKRVTMTKVPSWAQNFLNIFDVDVDVIKLSTSSMSLNAKKIVLPSFLKSGYMIDVATCRCAWLLASNALLSSAPRAETGQNLRLFITRKKWNSARPIDNIDEIETLAVRHGYALVVPESLTVREQAALFREATVVVGQDGSALHNVIFCRPGTVLGVISLQERCNLWHASISQAMGIRLAYVQVNKTPQGRNNLPVDQFSTFLDMLHTATNSGSNNILREISV
jgi:hypothetical protein